MFDQLNFVTQYWYYTLPLIIGFYIFNHMVLKVWIKIMLMKLKYGDKVCTYFYPMYGPFKKNKYESNNEDHLGHKMMVDHVVQNPKSKMLVSNNKSNVVYYLHDPDLIQEFMHQKMHHYLKYGLQRTYLFIEDLFIDGISIVDGPEWKYLRKVSAPAFHFKLLASKIDLIKKYANQMIDEIENHRKEKKEFDTYYHVLALTGSNLVAALMGDEFIQRYQKDHDILHEQDRLVTKSIVAIAMHSPRNYFRNWFFPNRKVYELPSWCISKDEKQLLKDCQSYAAKIDDYVRERVEKTRNGNPHPNSDFLEFHIQEYLKDQSLSQNDVTKMTIKLIRHQFTNMFTAGVGAPSSALSLCLTHLAMYPDWQEKIRQEMYEKFDFNADHNTIFQKLFNDMPILDAFQKEVFRQFCPSSGLFHFRVAQQDHTLGDFEIKKGQQVLVNILGNNNNPNSYDHPEKFDPTRWFNDVDDEGKRKINIFAYVPFMGGKRNCIGQHFAKLEIKLTMLTLLQKYKLERTDVPLRTNYNLNLRVKDGRVIKYIPL